MAPNPLLESLVLAADPDIERPPTQQDATEADRALPSSPPPSTGGGVGKNVGRRTALVLFSACCVAAICFGLVTFLADVELPPAASTPELKRVTHAPTIETGDGKLGETVAGYPHRTSFHFQPEKNWMNDPNGPMYYKGYYHFFYQYNPDAAVWGNIAWGHAVSRDLIHWLYLDLALLPDQWYDAQGVWSGSVTMRDDVPIILYTGASYASEQTQNVAYPEDPSDPLLRKWVKDPENPVLRHPPGVGIRDFRDPTTAWRDAEGRWLLSVGARRGTTGVALLYKSWDLKHWELQDRVLHAVPGTGMWECVDFFPVARLGQPGLDSYLPGPAVKYVLKVSRDDDRHDYYALGSYDAPSGGSFTPDDPARDAGVGLRYDYGKFYASKTFFDPVKQRRILWGWVNESDSEANDIAKGWASVQAIPRTLWYDTKTRSNLIQVPVEEVTALRGIKVSKKALELAAGQVVEVEGATGGQLDIEVVFDYPDVSKVAPNLDDAVEHFECSQGGAAHRGLFGPFGLLVLTDQHVQEQTAVFFYISYSSEGQWRAKFCSDQTRSSLLPDVDTTVYGSHVEVLPTEDFLSLRVLVDRSIVESFVQGGRMVITSRVYPTVAADRASHLYLFNNATTAINVRSINVWQMTSVPMHAI